LGLDGDYVVIEVTDGGSGIPAHILSKVFEPFFTTKEIGAGTGLGLSQVHGFVRQSKGAVDIESTPGKGTTVRLFIPAVAAAAEPGGAKAATPTQGVVLVVEDDPDVAEIATAMLEDCGFEVKLAANAQAALDHLSKGEMVDLVFTDIVMPGPLNGIDLAERVRREFPSIPVLLATGYSDKIRDLTAKGLQVIAKPYQAVELRERVFALLAA
jgi:two-component system NtrC family sensor kinase